MPCGEFGWARQIQKGTARPLRNNVKGALTKGAVALTMADLSTSGAIGLAGPSRADYQQGCVSQFWLWYHGDTATRTICDGPIQADGNWMRTRTFYHRSYWEPPQCPFCNPLQGPCDPMMCVPGHQVPEVNDRETYSVNPATVLPDEPGHIAGTWT